MYGQPLYVAFFFVGTGALLLATRCGRERNQTFGISEAILVGIAQAVAILPGFSRSGLTIAAALLLGIASVEAFEFSFLLSILAIAGAALIDFLELYGTGRLSQLAPHEAWVVGIIASAGVGFAALWVVKKTVISRKFWLFSFYCFAVGAASLVLLLILG
jgi:undecaprenyl-diphosphatase